MVQTRRVARQHKTFRLASSVVERLEERARETSTSVTALTERYIDEGLRRDAHPLIVFRDTAGDRRAALAGTRLDVWQIIETLKNSDGSISETADYLGVSETAVRAALRYYAAYKDEIDELTRRMHAISEREEDAWRREQAALA